jgi:hypothetical protein
MLQFNLTLNFRHISLAGIFKNRFVAILCIQQFIPLFILSFISCVVHGFADCIHLLSLYVPVDKYNIRKSKQA